MGLIAVMGHVHRLPVRSIQSLLHAQYGLSILVGENVDVCDAVAERGRDLCDHFPEDIRAGANVDANEAGWRQAGRNGWYRTFSTPAIRFFVHRMSRGSCVPKEVLGNNFKGVLSTDFYSACMDYFGEHPDDKTVAGWVRKVRSIYDRAKEYRHSRMGLAGTNRPRERPRMRPKLPAELVAVATPSAKTTTPQAKPANRIIRYEPDMFTLNEHPDIPSDNNAAERSLRPPFIARKTSGGTRSPAGSETRSTLASLFGTWTVRNLNPLTECVRMLAANH